MSVSPASGKPHPALAVRLTITLGLIMLAVGAVFSAIYFVLSVSLFSRLANQQLEQKAKSAEVIVRAVAHSRETINSMTFIRNLQNGGFSDAIAVFDEKGRLIAHTDEAISTALGRQLTDSKLKLREIEEQNKLVQDVLAYRRTRPVSLLYDLGDAHYRALIQDKATILIALTAQKPKMLTLATSFFLLCLLGVGINVLFVYHYGHSIAHSLAQIVRGIDVDSLRVESIDTQYLEVSELVHAVDEKIRMARTHAPVAAMSEAPKGDVTIATLQAQLFERPFPRMERYELAVYPRRPKPETHEFISGAYEQGHVDVFIGITDSDAVGALVVKHRMQERFWALAMENLSSDEFARNLWNAFFAHSEMVPGMFFARIDESAKTMDICRAGGVHLFEVTPEGTCEEINLGSTEFGSEYTMISEHRLTPGSYFVMVSQDAFSAMELSSGDFAQVISKLAASKSVKLLLAGLLEKIHQKLPAGETVPGMLAVLSERK
jgi:hypothetical protein